MLIFDNIHGYIEISDLASQIIDTVEFQRMRRITQTGGLKYVYPTACHTRFEHSIGTYFLSKELIKNIKSNQPELKISDKLVELVAIAGLCHDLGHVCFSHLFDELFLTDDNFPNLGKLKIHENRSVFLFKYIVEKYKINLDEYDIQVISDLIIPKDNDYQNWKDEYKVGKFILTIVSNEENSLDTDKFDYIKRDSNKTGLSLSIDYSRMISQARVIDDKICYPKQILKEIYNLFFVRYQLYKQLYTHKAVNGVDLLIRDCLKEMDKEYKISEWILEPEKYIYLTDDIIFNFNNPESVKKLTKKLEERNFYKLIEEIKIDINDEIPDHFKNSDN
jgi:HD superfamily phosphohydrolase